MECVLVVDDEPGIRSFIRQVLEGEGLEVVEAADGFEAKALLEKQTFHLMITDLKMPRLGGMELLTHARSAVPEMETLVLTAHGTVESAVQAMKLGAFDYLSKPLSGPPELRLLVQRALERRRLRQLSGATGPAQGESFIAVDPVSRAVLVKLERVAPTPATVLLLGESGTGKEVAAHWIHRHSARPEGPFVAVNCAAVSEQLVESEIFGHEKGAFTGAGARRQGRFELADGGTLFLDEVAELAPALQAKLLRVLQERCFERLGGTRAITVDVRVIAATNRDLEEEMRRGRFREDLYHRLAVFPVRLAPLRQRLEDLLPLAEHLLARIGREIGRTGLSLAPEAAAGLATYRWPGNVRELSNVLERAAILASGKTIRAEDLVLAPGGERSFEEVTILDAPLKQIERAAIVRALDACGQHRKKAAQRLGIGLRTLYDKIREYDL